MAGDSQIKTSREAALAKHVVPKMAPDSGCEAGDEDAGGGKLLAEAQAQQ